MPLSLARLEKDFLAVDGLVPVTLREHGEDGTAIRTIEIEKALPRATFDVLSVGQQLTAPNEQLTWHMLVSDVGAYQITKGWTIEEEDGTTWVVWSAQKQTLGIRWRLTCVKK